MRPKNLEKEEAIRRIALQMIAEDGLENLTMQKLAKAAGISPRTIYIKYANKEDLLVKLFIDEVLGTYEKAILENFNPDMDFADGVQRIWINGFRYFKANKYAFALMQYGKSSPLLNRAYQVRNIKQGDFFAPVLRFLEKHMAKKTIKKYPFEVHRALLFAPIIDLANEYFEHEDRPQQIITDQIIADACQTVIKGMLH